MPDRAPRTNMGQPGVEDAWDAAHASKHFRDALVDNKADLLPVEADLLRAKAEAIEESRLKKSPALARINQANAVAIARLRGEIDLMQEGLDNRASLAISTESLALIDKANKNREPGWGVKDLGRLVGLGKPKKLPYDKEIINKLIYEAGQVIIDRANQSIASEQVSSITERRSVREELLNAGTHINDGVQKAINDEPREGYWSASNDLGDRSRDISLFLSNTNAEKFKNASQSVKVAGRLSDLGRFAAVVGEGTLQETLAIIELMHDKFNPELDENDLIIINDVAIWARNSGNKELEKSAKSLDKFMSEEGYIFDPLEGYKKVQQLSY